MLDSVNPTATVIHLYLLGTTQPVARTIAFIVGVFAANYLGGLFAVLELEAFLQTLNADELIASPAIIRDSFQAILGLALLVAAWFFNRYAGTGGAVKKPKSPRPMHALMLGLTVTAAELPTALPYLAGIGVIAEAKLNPLQVATALLVYNVVFVLPLLVLLGLYLILRQTRAAWLAKLERLVSQWLPRLVPMFLVLLGSALLAISLASRFGHPFF